MDWYHSFFLIGQAPADAMQGTYNLKIVLLSYIIASFASYVALDMSSHLKKQNTTLFNITWLIGGAIVMGAGIWSMHFVGMLAFDMGMPMTFDLLWTGLSMVIAIITAGFAFVFFMIKTPKPVHYLLSGIILGTAIPAMHYTGMAGMNDVIIHYIPSLFVLSILIAVFAATAALWLSAHSDSGPYMHRIRTKIVSALIMGVAICGMHYMGMFAAVFTMPENMAHDMATAAHPTVMAILISTMVLCIMIVALILSSTRYYVTTKVQNERDFLEVVLNSLSGGVMAFDQNKKIRLYNNSMKHFFRNIENQHTAADLETNFPLLKLDHQTPLKGKDYPLEAIYTGQKVKSLEVIAANPDDKDYILSIDGHLLKGQESEPLGAVMVYQDITERKKIDQMKNEFISTVSHELRTPLTSIRGSLGLIMGGAMGEVPKEIASLLEIASNNSERLVRLINDILDTEKIEAGKMIFHFNRSDLSKLIEQAVVSNKAYADKYKVTYQIKNLIPDVHVVMDSDRIRQVLDNLLSNAAKFSKAGGAVTIDMARIGNYVRVYIADTGLGIPKEFQKRIFSKFYQADSSDVREKGGTGLGLSICKAIIESHKGKIDFNSTPDVGTTFYFDLLEAKDEAEEITLMSDSLTNKRILICEDDPDVGKLLGLILKERGFSSLRVATIHDAKKALETQEFSLMTLDLMLPDGNGLDLLKWMRSKPQLEKLPVVVISAVSIEQEKLKGSALGIVDWINKPIDEERLYKDVAQALGAGNTEFKHKILHIEDNKDIAKIVSKVLSDICETDICPSVHAAMKMLANVKYELIILDLNLQDGTGYDVLTYLEEHGYNIPVVILSVDEIDPDISRNISASLVKSKVTNADLLDKIVSIVEKNHGNKE